MEDTILFVDDEVIILRALQMIFSREGYHTLTATSGEDALKILEEEEVSVVVSDEKMPGLTGIEFLSEVKEKYPDKIRILLTAFVELNTLLSAVNKVEAHRLIIKPFKNDELVETVREVMSRRKREQKDRISLEAASREVEFAYGATRIICSMELSLSEKYRRILGLIKDCIQARTLSLMIVHPEANELVVLAATNERILGLKRALRENTISSWVAREGRSFSYSDAPGYPAGFLPHDKTLSRYQSGTFLSVPVMNEKRMVGVFNVTDPVSGKITPSTEKTVSHLMRWIGAMIPPAHSDGVKRADE